MLADTSNMYLTQNGENAARKCPYPIVTGYPEQKEKKKKPTLIPTPTRQSTFDAIHAQSARKCFR
jgi:hypothetical protein